MQKQFLKKKRILNRLRIDEHSKIAERHFISKDLHNESLPMTSSKKCDVIEIRPETVFEISHFEIPQF